MSFAVRILEYRKRSGMGQEEFAKRVGLHLMHYVKIEKSKNSPPNLGTLLIMIGVLSPYISPQEAVSLLQEATYLPEVLNVVSIGEVKELAERLEAFEAIAQAMTILQSPFAELKQKFLGIVSN